MRRLLALGMAASLILGVVGSAAAASPVTIQITGADLTAKIQVTLTYDVVCEPLVDPFSGEPVTQAAFGGAGRVQQAAGRSIATAEGGDTMPDPNVLVTCDGSTLNHVSTTMVSSTVPFHGGTAVASVSVSVDVPSCTFCGAGQHASVSGTVKLH